MNLRATLITPHSTFGADETSVVQRVAPARGSRGCERLQTLAPPPSYSPGLHLAVAVLYVPRSIGGGGRFPRGVEGSTLSGTRGLPDMHAPHGQERRRRASVSCNPRDGLGAHASGEIATRELSSTK